MTGRHFCEMDKQTHTSDYPLILHLGKEALRLATRRTLLLLNVGHWGEGGRERTGKASEVGHWDCGIRSECAQTLTICSSLSHANLIAERGHQMMIDSIQTCTPLSMNKCSMLVWTMECRSGMCVSSRLACLTRFGGVLLPGQAQGYGAH